MTIRLRERSGEAVMLVIMGVMVVGGIVALLATGHFHMMPMHGDGHTGEKRMKEEAAPPVPHDSRRGSADSRLEGLPMEHNEQESKEK